MTGDDGQLQLLQCSSKTLKPISKLHHDSISQSVEPSASQSVSQPVHLCLSYSNLLHWFILRNRLIPSILCTSHSTIHQLLAALHTLLPSTRYCLGCLLYPRVWLCYLLYPCVVSHLLLPHAAAAHVLSRLLPNALATLMLLPADVLPATLPHSRYCLLLPTPSPPA